MAIPLVINSVTFNYPVDFDEAWGIAATGWAQAVTSGMLQMAGGSFPLTADVNFGANFGILSKYFETRSSNPATAGTVRLSSADAGIAFRNNANSGNLVLTTDASDNLVWSSGLLIQNQNSLGLQDSGSAHTISIHAPATSVNYSITLPVNAGSSGQVLSTNGSGVTSWINAAGGGTVNSGTAGRLAYYATTGAAVSDQAVVTISGSSVSLNSNGIINVADPALAQDAATKNYVDTIGAVAISTVGGGTFASSGVAQTITSLTLSAGRWLVSAILTAAISGSTWTGVTIGIAGVAASLSGLTATVNLCDTEFASSSTTPVRINPVVVDFYLTPVASTTYYFNASAAFSAGNPAYDAGTLRAHRIGF